MIRTQNLEFQNCLTCYAESFHEILEYARLHGTELLALFEMLPGEEEAAKHRLCELLDSWMPEIMKLFSVQLVRDAAAFRQELIESGRLKEEQI